MSQSLSKIWTHLIFSTKDRYPFLSDETIRRDLHTYLASILKANNCPTLIVGGVSDHVHALFVLSKNHSVADIVYEIKRSSSKWVKRQLKNYQADPNNGKSWEAFEQEITAELNHPPGE